MIQFKSINHLNTSLVEREEYYKQLIQDADSPSLFLQTCNRVELYYGTGDVPDDVARHLFRVICGLESAINADDLTPGKSLLAIDLAFPRDIDPAIAQMKNITKHSRKYRLTFGYDLGDALGHGHDSEDRRQAQ